MLCGDGFIRWMGPPQFGQVCFNVGSDTCSMFQHMEMCLLIVCVIWTGHLLSDRSTASKFPFMYIPRHTNGIQTLHVIKAELNDLFGCIALNDASLRTCSVPYIVLKNAHEAFKWVHASEIYGATHLYLVHNVNNEMYHYVKEQWREYHLQMAESQHHISF